jgi:hypothetical protein
VNLTGPASADFAGTGAAERSTTSTSLADPAGTTGGRPGPALIAAHLPGGVATVGTVAWWHPDTDRGAGAGNVAPADTEAAHR